MNEGWRSGRRGGGRGGEAERRFHDPYDRLCEERWPRPPESVLVETRFGTTHAFRWSGLGQPIVFLPGFGATSLMWVGYITPLAGRPLYAIDLIGDVDRKSTRLNSSHLVISYAV